MYMKVVKVLGWILCVFCLLLFLTSLSSDSSGVAVFFLICAIILCPLTYKLILKKPSDSNQNDNEKNKNMKYVLNLTSNVGNLTPGKNVMLTLEDEKIVINGIFEQKTVSLSYDKITDLYYGMEHEIVEKNKSVIGRAVAGGLLFGGTGAIVGAISGTGKKEKKKLKFVFVISYKDSENNDAFISFEDVNANGAKAYRQLKGMINIPDNSCVEL